MYDIIDQPLQKIALLGGVYNNHLALEAVLQDCATRGADITFFLGDCGGFGPHPDLSIEILKNSHRRCMQGNYDDSVARGLDDCQCGYTHPRDNHFARLSYQYTFENTSESNRQWLGSLPEGFRLTLGTHRLLLSHGSPRKINEFLWYSTTPRGFIHRLCQQYNADLICCTHTGIHWKRQYQLEGEAGFGLVNVGCIGRPANDGTPRVWYTLISAEKEQPKVEFIPVTYNHKALAQQMHAEQLPGEFIDTITSGHWTTCLEILPSKERSVSRF